MLRWIDRSAAILLALFAAGHGIVGTLAMSPLSEEITLWSFSGSIAAWLIAAMNWMRTSRPDDRVLAFWCLAGAVAWIALMFWLMSIRPGFWVDPRPWLFNAVCAVLAAFSLQALLRKRA
jgi:hypothetical protein